MIYGVIFWGFSSNRNYERVFRMQKWCIRSIFQLRCRDSCKQIFIGNGILTLAGLVGFEYCMFIRRNPHLFSDHAHLHSYPTRGGKLVSLKHCTAKFDFDPMSGSKTAYVFIFIAVYLASKLLLLFSPAMLTYPQLNLN